ncbi:MAG: peptidoglycan-associated lipoprotein Pal [Deltaproteobacteria bacterium]|nr:peptidoglycan-associated lipoprotein Pal [Deltaproteobacteria bacterium]
MSEIIRNGRGSGIVALVLALGLVFVWACTAKTPVITGTVATTGAAGAGAGAAAGAASTIGDYAFTNIYFDYDRSTIRPDATDVLKKHAAWLKKNAGYAVKVEGYCDERGTEAYNMVLGKKRAAAAKAYLAKQGVNAKRISTVSYGEGKPVCTEMMESCWAKNRRAQFVVTPKK